MGQPFFYSFDTFGTKEIIDLSKDTLPDITEVKSMFAETLENVVEQKYTTGHY